MQVLNRPLRKIRTRENQRRMLDTSIATLEMVSLSGLRLHCLQSNSSMLSLPSSALLYDHRNPRDDAERHNPHRIVP